MMKIIDVVGYILKHYPHDKELAKGRLNKLIYLADWKSAIDNGEQLTSIQWLLNRYGPYVNDIEKAISLNDKIKIEPQVNYFGNEKHLVKLIDKTGFEEPNEKEKKILDFIINVTKDLNYNQFINAVYSTYPVKVCEKGTYLNLIELAQQYKKI